MKPSLNLKEIQALILDMDGVLWQGEQPIGDLPRIFSIIAELGWKVILATNNATRSSDQFIQKMERFGVHLEPWQVINSPEVTVQYLKHKYPLGGALYIIGEEGLKQTLLHSGFYHAEKDVLAVVVGLDREINYEKLTRATLLIRSGVPFIGTNPDRTYPMPEGLVPGAGSVIAAVETATDVKPVIMGKPMPEMYRACLERLQIKAENALVVGDRTETDIAAGQVLGCRTALVLSGATTLETARAWKPAPDWIGKDLMTLVSEAFPRS
jgi:4-nitrophenyl phosphatase